MFRDLFSRKAPLRGTPATARLKTYAAESGYVYHYFYQGWRPRRAGGEAGLEFVFRISADRKEWLDTAVFLSSAAIGSWEGAHGRELNSAERYAIAKLALFQAFDERPAPARMNEQVRIREADIEPIAEKLGL